MTAGDWLTVLAVLVGAGAFGVAAGYLAMLPDLPWDEEER